MTEPLQPLPPHGSDAPKPPLTNRQRGGIAWAVVAVVTAFPALPLAFFFFLMGAIGGFGWSLMLAVVVVATPVVAGILAISMAGDAVGGWVLWVGVACSAIVGLLLVWSLVYK